MHPTWTRVLWVTALLGASTTRGCLNDTRLGFRAINARNNAAQWSTEVTFDHGEEWSNEKNWTIELHENTLECSGVIRFSVASCEPAPRVVPGYDYIPGVGYYKTHPPGKNWEEARRTCVREGGHLAIINSEVESTVLQLMFARTTSQQPFALIGFHDHYTEGEYLTIYDLPVKKTGFNRWGGGQPDNAGGVEHCGSIYRHDGSLNDIDCAATVWPFICEQEL